MFTLEKEGFQHSDLQAVILAGNGNNRLYPLTEEENLPKSLLPIANEPMLYYQLNWLESAKIKNILIVTQQQTGKKIREYINKIYEVPIGTKIDLVLLDELIGSADALRSVRDKIKTDFIVLSGDSIPNFPAYPMINLFKTQNASATILVTESLKSSAATADSSKSAKDDDFDEFIAVDQSTNRLLMLANKSDFDDELPVRVSMLRKFPQIKMYSNLRDIHVYLFKHWVIDLIVSEKQVSSIKSELIPILSKSQYSKTFADAHSITKFSNMNIIQSADFFKEVHMLSSFSMQHQKHKSSQQQEQVLCLAYIAPSSDLCARANSLWAYSEINRQIMKLKDEANRIAQNVYIHQRTQLAQDCLVGEGTKIGERCSVKKSIIGSHCQIGKDVKMNNCIVMDYVVIEDGARLDGCIICNNAKVSEKAHLKDCEVGGKFTVEEEASAKNEILA